MTKSSVIKDDIENKLLGNINKLKIWFNNYKLKININKTKILNYNDNITSIFKSLENGSHYKLLYNYWW